MHRIGIPVSLITTLRLTMAEDRSTYLVINAVYFRFVHPNTFIILPI